MGNPSLEDRVALKLLLQIRSYATTLYISEGVENEACIRESTRLLGMVDMVHVFIDQGESNLCHLAMRLFRSVMYDSTRSVEENKRRAFLFCTTNISYTR